MTTKLNENEVNAALVLANGAIQRHLNSSHLPNPSVTPFVPITSMGLQHEAPAEAEIEDRSHLARRNLPSTSLTKSVSAEDSGGRGLDEVPSLTEDGGDNNSDSSPSETCSGHRVYAGIFGQRKSLEEQHYDNPYANPWIDE